MTLPDDILGQTRPLSILQSYLANDTIPHAFLFSGPDGVGKKSAARLLAMALNCQNTSKTPPNSLNTGFGCGVCRACRLIAQNKYPDFLQLAPEGAFIKVDQVRRLIEALALKPVEARVRVVLMENAQLMNPAAANALLKTLEEPFDDTVFVLTCLTQTEVMPTILSRCQRVPFAPLTANIMQTLLQNQAPQDTDWEHIAYLGAGSLSMAQTLLKPETVQNRKWLLGEMAALPKAAPARVLSLANELYKSRQNLAFNLEIMLSWFRDLASLKISAGSVINRDFISQLQYNSNLYRPGDLNDRLTLLQNAVPKLTAGTNTNPRLGLEHLLLALK